MNFTITFTNHEPPLLIRTGLDSSEEQESCAPDGYETPVTSERLPHHKVKKGKGLPQQAEVAQGVPGGLRPRIFLTFGTTRVVRRQPHAPAAFTPREIPGTHF